MHLGKRFRCKGFLFIQFALPYKDDDKLAAFAKWNKVPSDVEPRIAEEWVKQEESPKYKEQ